MTVDAVSTFALHVAVPDEGPGWLVTQVLIDGENPYAEVAPGWHGAYPGALVDPPSPLLPTDPARRVAVYGCSCGEFGCGVIAVLIIASADGRRISWVDPRNYTAAFSGPLPDAPIGWEGRRWEDVPPLHFDRDQYLAEIERVRTDRFWETPARATARLVRERIQRLELVLPPDLTLSWTSPAWRGTGILLAFEHRTGPHRIDLDQVVLHLTSDHLSPEHAAPDIVRQLLATSADQWKRTFEWKED